MTENKKSKMQVVGRGLGVTLLALFVTGCFSSSSELSRELMAGNDAALRGDYASSIMHYEKALQDTPSSMAAKRNLGIVLVKVGNYKKAKSLLMEVQSEYSNDIEVYYYLGESSRGLDLYAEAAQFFQKGLRIDPSDLRVIKSMAWCHYKLRQLDKAQQLVEPLLATNPQDLQLRLILANVMVRQKRFKDATQLLADFEKSGYKVVSKDQVSSDSEKGLLLNVLGEAWYGLGRCDRAETLYQEVLRIRPFLSTSLTGSAKCDLKSGNTASAVEKLKKATHSDPDAPEPHFLLARLLEKTEPTYAIFLHRRFLLLTQNLPDFANEVKISRGVLAQLEKQGTN